MHQTTPTVYGKLIYTIGVATLLYNVNLNESFTLLVWQNISLGLSTTIFLVILAILQKIGWNVELMVRDQNNRWNNLQIEDWRT